MGYCLAIKRNEVLIYTKPHGQILKTLCSVKGASCKGLPMVWFHLEEMSRIAKYRDQE